MIEIRAAATIEEVLAAAGLFDEAPEPDATARFLAEPTHHLLLARIDADGPAVGFVSGVEITHPDKGTEMMLYELGVDESARGRGVGRALVQALGGLAAERGCRVMFVLTEAGNGAARRTYASAGGTEEPDAVVSIVWDL